MLSGRALDGLKINFKDASDRQAPLAVGYNDLFLATAWWTAHAARAAARMTRTKRIYYLIQDYEPCFYGAGENFADAEASYAFDHVPIVNTNLLRDHLAKQKVGRFSDPKFASSALVFEPAVDTTHFYPVARERNARRRLLFYARPTIARRNMFGLGIATLRAAVAAGLFDREEWEFIGMGEAFDPVFLGRGYILTPMPWLDFRSYATQMRKADILLSLMMSPHPSYPPLEMAASGGIVVTTTFGSKTAERLSALSPRLIGVPPDVEELVLGMTRALLWIDDPQSRGVGAKDLALPKTWVESLSNVILALISELADDGLIALDSPQLESPRSFVRTDEEVALSPPFYQERLRARAREYRNGSVDNLISLVTTVYNTDAGYLRDLAHSVLGQDSHTNFEWLILITALLLKQQNWNSRRSKPTRVSACIALRKMQALLEGWRRCLRMPQADILSRSIATTYYSPIVCATSGIFGAVRLPDDCLY